MQTIGIYYTFNIIILSINKKQFILTNEEEIFIKDKYKHWYDILRNLFPLILIKNNTLENINYNIDILINIIKQEINSNNIIFNISGNDTYKNFKINLDIVNSFDNILINKIKEISNNINILSNYDIKAFMSKSINVKKRKDFRGSKLSTKQIYDILIKYHEDNNINNQIYNLLKYFYNDIYFNKNGIKPIECLNYSWWLSQYNKDN